MDDTVNWVMTKPKRVNEKYYAYFKEEREKGDKQKILFQFPKMNYKGNISIDDTNEQIFTNFVIKENDVKRNLKAIDEQMLEYVKSNKSEIFKSKEVTDEMIEVGQSESVKEIRSEYVIQLNIEKGVEVYDTKKENIDVNEIEKKCEISTIVQFVGLWFSASRWGIAWKVKQMRMHKDKKMKGYMFDDNEEESDDEMAFPPGV